MLWYYMYPSTKGVTDLPFYVVSIGLHELQPRIERPNGYDYDQFFYNCTGSGWLEINDHKYELPEGSSFFYSSKKTTLLLSGWGCVGYSLDGTRWKQPDTSLP